MKSIQCVRGLAALLVVYFHAVLQTRDLFGETAHLPLFGRCGVDIFFVLSGFIIWTSTSRLPVSPGAFIARRFLRVAPLYWSLTLAAVLVSLVAPSALRSTRFEWHHAAASLLFLPAINPAITAPGSSDLVTPVIIPGWTLNFEMAFYVLFAVSLLAGIGRRLAVAAMVFLGAAAALAALSQWFPLAGFYDPLLFAEFFCGVLLAALRTALPRPGTGGAAVLLLLAAAAILGFDAAGWPVHRFIVAGLPAAVIVAMAVELDPKVRWVRLPPLVALGDASFSLYLVHVFVLAGLRVAWVHAFGGATGLWPALAFTALALGLSCVAAALVYRHFERPLGRRLHRWTAATAAAPAPAAERGATARGLPRALPEPADADPRRLSRPDQAAAALALAPRGPNGA